MDDKITITVAGSLPNLEGEFHVLIGDEIFRARRMSMRVLAVDEPSRWVRWRWWIRRRLWRRISSQL